MHGRIVFINKPLRRGVGPDLVAGGPQKAVQGVAPVSIVINEKDRKAPRTGCPHNLTRITQTAQRATSFSDASRILPVCLTDKELLFTFFFFFL